MKVAVVGTGHWGRNHARTFAGLRDEGVIESFIVCDRDATVARKVAEANGAGWSDDFEALLRDDDLDALTLATPTPLHHSMALAALQAGKHILVEKPMASTHAEAQELRSVAEDAGLTLMPGHLFRYHPAVQDLQRRVAEGGLGGIQNMHVVRQDFRAARPDMGVVQALGIHEIDLFPFLVGRRPQQVFCDGTSFHREGIEESATILWKFPGGLRAQAWESWNSPHARERTLAVAGDRATAFIDFMVHDEYQIVHASIQEMDGDLVGQRRDVETIRFAPAAPLEQELRDLVHCARTGSTPLADATSGCEAVAWMEATERSLASGTWQSPA